jgi:hypothetical protein
MYRWFTDRAIEAAVKSGRLGGAEGFEGEKPLAEMRLHEAEDRAAMEKRTGKDLSYEFSMPFPGRRQLPDVTTFVTQMCTSFDPNGVNIPFRKVGRSDPGAPAQAAWIPEELRALVQEFEVDTGALFDQLVGSPAMAAALQLTAAGSNGHGE